MDELGSNSHHSNGLCRTRSDRFAIISHLPSRANAPAQPPDVKNVINTFVGFSAIDFGVIASALGATEHPPIVNPPEIGCLVRPISGSLSFLLFPTVRKGIWQASDFLHLGIWRISVYIKKRMPVGNILIHFPQLDR